jgi:hypothetical protein
VEEIGFIAMRRKFVVHDKSEIEKCMFSITCRGGYVLYLNGKEVSRGDMPKGTIRYNTSSTHEYPIEAFREMRKNGKPGKFLDWWKHKHTKYHPQWALREKRMPSIEIPLKLIRNGVNILALGLHRSDYPAFAAKFPKTRRNAYGLGFAAIGVSELSFTAYASPDSITGGSNRHTGNIYIWNTSLWDTLYPHSRPPAFEKPKPVRIFGTRNGTFRAKIAAGSEGPIENLEADLSPLTGPGGIIPVRIAYASPNPLVGSRLDILLNSPPAHIENSKKPSFTAVSIWIFADVPRNTRPGIYQSSLTVKAQGKDPVSVPVRVSVADWTLPNPEDRVSVMHLYQSPDTLAEYYKMPLWSEKHWALIEKSLKILGKNGNGSLLFPLLAKGQSGNRESMVCWIQQKNGSFTYDFSVFDQYLETAMKYHKPKQITAAIINLFGKEAMSKHRAHVTLLDPKTGKKTDMRLPDYTNPEAERLLKPLILAVKKKLKSTGIAGSMMIGTTSDGADKSNHFAVFKKILPDVSWFRFSHYDRKTIIYNTKDSSKTIPVGCNANVWSDPIPDPAQQRLFGWRSSRSHLVLSFNRFGVQSLVMKPYSPPLSFHIWMEASLALGRQGFGRVGADFFPVIDRGSRSAIPIENRYPESSLLGSLAFFRSVYHLLGPAKKGPVTTVRFENMLEGIQQTEARIFIEKAVLKKNIPEDLAAKCRALVDKRTNRIRFWPAGAAGIIAQDWPELTKELFQAAAEVSEHIQD